VAARHDRRPGARRLLHGQGRRRQPDPAGGGRLRQARDHRGRDRAGQDPHPSRGRAGLARGARLLALAHTVLAPGPAGRRRRRRALSGLGRVLLRERHEPARRRRLDGVLRPRVLWINPAGTEPVEAFAERIRGDVDVTLLGLRVWGLAPGDGYDMGVEVAAVAEAAGSGAVHLAGFSAGAAVSLAAALALGDSVRSVVVLEPAFIGDDDWDPAEAKWRSAIGSLRAAAGAEQAETFREMLMAAGERAPPSRRPVAWDF